MTVKIINVTHKKYFLPISSCVIPMHAGRKIAQEKSKDGFISKADFLWLKKNTLGDDTGDNISDLNRYYNEMSCIYWVWKNYRQIGNPDFVGFMHYRRHFILKDDLKISGDYVEDLGLTEKTLEKLTQKYDLIHPKFMTIKQGTFIENIGTKFCSLGGQKVQQAIKLSLDIIKEKFPHQFNEIYDVFYGKKTGSFCNMFIMKKSLFFEYCDWIFKILFELDKHLGRCYEQGQERCLGWMAEMLTSVFIYLKSKEVSHKEVFVFNQDPVVSKNSFEIFMIKIKSFMTYKAKKNKYTNALYNHLLEKYYQKLYLKG